MAFKLFKFVIAGLGTVLAWFCIWIIYTEFTIIAHELGIVLDRFMLIIYPLIGFSIGLIMASWGLRAMWSDRLNEIKKKKKLAKKDKKRLKKEARRQAKNKSS